MRKIILLRFNNLIIVFLLLALFVKLVHLQESEAQNAEFVDWLQENTVLSDVVYCKLENEYGAIFLEMTTGENITDAEIIPRLNASIFDKSVRIMCSRRLVFKGTNISTERFLEGKYTKQPE